MPASTGKTGRGVTLAISGGESPPDFVTIANLATISRTGRSADEIDFTHLASEGGYREFRQGFKDGGEIGFDMHFNPTEPSHIDLLQRFLDGQVIDWRIDYSGQGWDMYEVGKGYVSNPGDITINVDDPIGGSGTIRVTGATAYEAIP